MSSAESDACPNAYVCPSSGGVECLCHGGFDRCCDGPDCPGNSFRGDDPGLPAFPIDELTLGMVEHALGYCLTYEGEQGEDLDEPRGIGAEFSLHSLLDFLSGTTTDPLGVVQHLGVVDTFIGPAEMTVDDRPHYTEKDIILALIAEVRRLRQTCPPPPALSMSTP